MERRALAVGAFAVTLTLIVLSACGGQNATSAPNASDATSPQSASAHRLTAPPVAVPTGEPSAPTASNPNPSPIPASTPTPFRTATPSPPPSATPSEQPTIKALSHWQDGSGRRFGDVWGEGSFAYIGHSYDGGGVQILDISDPANPLHTATWYPASGDSRSQDVQVSRGIGYFGAEGGSGVHVVDVRDPYRPATLAVIDASNGGPDYFHNLFVDQQYLYVADNRTPSVRVFDMQDPANPVKVQTIKVPDVPKVHDVTLMDGRLYTSGGSHTHIFDVSDITTPTLLGSFRSGEKTHSSWPTPDARYLAVSNEVPGGAITIWNIDRPNAAVSVATLDPQVLGFGNIAAHNPVIINNMLYVSWLSAGLQLFDLTNPTEPKHLAGFDTTDGGDKPSLGGGAWGVYPFLGHDLVLVSDEDTGLWLLDAGAIADK